MFAIDTVPEVVDSPEAGELLMKIIESAWKLEKGRKTAVRTAIRSAFHLNETKKTSPLGAEFPLADWKK